MSTPRMSESGLRQLAVDIVEGRVFTDRMLGHDTSLVGMVFMPLLFMDDLKTASAEWGMVYEEMAQAGPRAINGYPIFTSVRVVHVDDMPQLQSFIEDFSKRRASFLKA